MAITLAQTYVPLLDEVYKKGALTSILDAGDKEVTLASSGKEFKLPKMELDGLADTTRGGDYVDGEETLIWETKAPDYDRNRMFKIDSRDNAETAGIAYGMLAGEFQRTKVIPEIDAVRFAKYSQNAGKQVRGTISSASEFLSALKNATSELDDKEVPEEGRILYATPAMINDVLVLDTTKSKEILNKFERIIKVPSGRFYDAITLNDGKTNGQEAGGFKASTTTYVKTADTALDSSKTYYTLSGSTYTSVASPNVSNIGTYFEKLGHGLNFLIVHKSALIQKALHVAPKIITPEQNQSGDNWKFGYRIYAIAEIKDNKKDAIYSHAKIA